MIKVLFVCLGNICRSPMADAVFAQMVKEAGLSDKIKVDSAGTGGWHIGETAHRGTLQVLRKNSIPYNGRARQFITKDLSGFDYVLAMDRSNLSNIQRMMPNGKTNNAKQAEVRMFLSYANDADKTNVEEVPDPYYNGQFDYVYDLVHTGSEALLNHIKHVHKL